MEQEEKKEESAASENTCAERAEKNRKLRSRKFIVWLAWLFFAVSSVFVENLPKEKIFEFFGFVSLIYIGANVAQDYAVKGKGGRTNG